MRRKQSHMTATTAASAVPALLASGAAHAGPLKRVVMIIMEDTDAERNGNSSHNYGSAEKALNFNYALMPNHAHADNFRDTLPHCTPSEPHYV
jgi:hypothetical protein